VRSLVALVLAIVAVGCQAQGSTDPITAELLRQYRLTASGPTVTTTLQIGDPAEIPWLLYREVSQQIGLDFADLAGQSAELRTTPINGGAPGTRLHALVAGGALRGAWLSADEMAPGIFSLTDPP
jgi:hypothetical protein